MLETQNKISKLSEIETGSTIVISKVAGSGAFRKRITEMGFIRGKRVKVIRNAPLQDPIEYELMGYNISLRRNEAAMIQVVTEEEARLMSEMPFEGVLPGISLNTTNGNGEKKIRVALVGNPNSGKTTLFNYASGSREKVGNYGGVTIEAKEAIINYKDYSLSIFDLPGTYSITEYTPEELFVRSHIIDNKPDVVVNVVDSSNLERNLFLTTQLIDMNIKVVIALNMYDEMKKKAVFDYRELGRMIGMPIVPTVAYKGKGITDLIRKIIDVYENSDPSVRSIQINYGVDIENSISRIQERFKNCSGITGKYYSRYIAIKLLERDKAVTELFEKHNYCKEVVEIAGKEIPRLEKVFGERSETIIADAKYGFIAGALKETYREIVDEKVGKKDIDKILTHTIFGFPIFIFFMWLMFQATFTLGGYPMAWIDTGIGMLGSLIGQLLPAGPLHDLIVDGIIGGVGGVIIFLPNILILFFFISLMEDTGYMARVSFIMDRLMHKIGLHGKSFIPLLMGFGCNVPAIMATRTLESRKDRILTMLIVPFMSCSARLPVYILIISAFFPSRQGLVLFGVYFTGILIGILVALLFKKTIFRKQEAPFVMELPPYRIPTIRNTTLHMWYKGGQYLKKMGSVILVASIFIWALSYYPRNVEFAENYNSQIQQVNDNNMLSEAEKKEKTAELELLKESERQERSYIGMMGHFIEPVIRPLGFDWKIGVSIITGLAAKEIVVSSMGILYQADMESDDESGHLINKLREQEHRNGRLKGEKVFSPLVAIGFMLFVLIYFPCIAVIAGINKESNWKWSVFTMFYTTAIAWVVAFLTYNVGNLIF